MYPGPTPWQVRSSFVEPVAIPAPAPGDEPLVCVSFNRGWLPVVLGALLQLAQPAAWAAPSDAARTAVLLDVQDLLAAFGGAGGCMELRWHDANCSLQVSTDAGATWTNVAGWPDPGPPDCLHPTLRIDAGGNLQISFDGGVTWTTITGWPPPPPPNPGGASTAQLACNIATHLAQNIIQGALVSAIHSFDTSISDGLAVSALVALIPGFGPESALAIDAAIGIVYLIYNTGSLSDYRTASTSAVLASDLQCAIYHAILADGMVTAGNYAAVVAAIAAIGYTPSDVQTAINSFVSTLGQNGLLAAQQAGGIVQGNCAACGGGQPCAVFNGTDDFLVASSLAGFHSAPFSVIGWTSSATSAANVIGKDRAAALNGWMLNCGGAGSPSMFFLTNNGPSSANVQISGSAANGPSATAATWDGAIAKLYRAGAQVATGADTIPAASDGTQGVAIGKVTGQPFFNGKMLDLRLYSGVLSPADIATFYTTGPGAYPVLSSAPLVAQWKFADLAGGAAADSSGNGHSAAWNGTGAHWGAW